ncbi:MAG: hypothetical protein ACE5I1_32495, partial [bacterium]
MEPMSVRIGQILLEKGIINQVIFEKALGTLKRNGNKNNSLAHRRLQEILIEDFQIDRHEIYSAISELYAIKELNLRADTVDDIQLDFIRKTLDSCSEKIRDKLLHKKVLPFRPHDSSAKILTVIAADPLDRDIPFLLCDLPYKQFEIAYGPREHVEELIDRVMIFKNEFLQQIEVSL